VVALTLTKTGKFYLFDKTIKVLKMEMFVSLSNDFKKLGFRRATYQGFFVETLFFCLKKKNPSQIYASKPNFTSKQIIIEKSLNLLGFSGFAR
jgi:hypothetical protein